jgi:SP family sugar:H+ symporter-like MFS transporter
MTSTYQLMLTVGIFVAALSGLSLLSAPGGWRTAIRLQMIPATITLVLMPFLPRSPRWLVQQGRLQEAIDVLVRLRGKDNALAEFQGIKDDSDESKRTGLPKWSEVFTGRIGRLVAIGSALQFLKQFVGMTAIMYFSPRIFGSLMQFETRLNFFQTVTNGINVVATLPALYFADKAGRRLMLAVGGMGMCVSSLIMAVLGLSFLHRSSAEGEHEVGYHSYLIWDGKGWKYLAFPFEIRGSDSLAFTVSTVMVLCVFVFVVTFASTWGPMVWVYCCEIFPLKYRGRCIGVTTTTNWVGNFLITLLTPIALDRFGSGTFFIFSFFAFLSFLIGMWIPETQGLMLEDIAKVFDQRFGEAEFAGDIKALRAREDTYGSTEFLEENMPPATRGVTR